MQTWHFIKIEAVPKAEISPIVNAANPIAGNVYSQPSGTPFAML